MAVKTEDKDEDEAEVKENPHEKLDAKMYRLKNWFCCGRKMPIRPKDFAKKKPKEG